MLPHKTRRKPNVTRHGKPPHSRYLVTTITIGAIDVSQGIRADTYW